VGQDDARDVRRRGREVHGPRVAGVTSPQGSVIVGMGAPLYRGA
jgi:hypothetical protein